MRVGVLGIGKTPHKIQHEKSLRDLVVESGRAAMADAGVDPADIQALYVGNVGSVGFNYENSTGLMAAHHLGLFLPERYESRPPAAPVHGRCTWVVSRSSRGSTTPSWCSVPRR